MDSDARKYLRLYKKELAGTTNPQDIHGKVATWLWKHRGEVPHIVGELNRGLRLAGAKEFKQHIPTLAVGSMSGLVYVSANPGYSAKANPIEQGLREVSAAKNSRFCSDIYRELPSCGASAWWTRALKFAYCVQTGEDYPVGIPSKEFWAWARGDAAVGGHARAAVGNVDLIPFHSTSDGFGSMSGSGKSSQELRDVAVQTLKCLLRLQPAPRLLFIASSNGLALLNAEHKVFDLEPESAPRERELGSLFKVYTHRATGRKVAVFGRQIFAGNFSMNKPEGFSWTSLAGLLRPLADPPY